MTNEQKLQRIEQENAFSKVYCDDCTYKCGDRCLHPNARTYDDTPSCRAVTYADIDTRNAHNDCPDFTALSRWTKFFDDYVDGPLGAFILMIALAVVLYFFLS